LVKAEYSVGEIAEFCHCSPSQTCEHLRHMLRCGLLTSQRRGRNVYYKATSLRLHNLTQCLLKTCLQKQNETSPKR
jgi:predicted transcriptional regulator